MKWFGLETNAEASEQDALMTIVSARTNAGGLLEPEIVGPPKL